MLSVTTPITEPVNGYSVGFSANPAIASEVNRSATYSVSFSLNADEVAAFELQGPAFAQELALRVDSDPDSFRSRAI